ncbi:hypothetical protein WN48_00951 [Eufriesea mexicana]|uniref:Uncharacterized protein n=1 Tax=Eufriesea mexicana TaxID=516756 RepID=A0A310SBH5_9HYME|nr:hypothetical protein WN48_00951 [Eufriesea mexicana]
MKGKGKDAFRPGPASGLITEALSSRPLDGDTIAKSGSYTYIGSGGSPITCEKVLEPPRSWSPSSGEDILYFSQTLIDQILLEDLLEKVPSGGDDATWVTWKMALMIAMPICAICVVVMVVYHVRKTPERPGNSDDSQEAPDRPILGGVTIRDMLEMTTSGSGSELSKGIPVHQSSPNVKTRQSQNWYHWAIYNLWMSCRNSSEQFCHP